MYYAINWSLMIEAKVEIKLPISRVVKLILITGNFKVMEWLFRTYIHGDKEKPLKAYDPEQSISGLVLMNTKYFNYLKLTSVTIMKIVIGPP